MKKLQQLFRPAPMESLSFQATRRMLWLVTLGLLCVLIPAGANNILRPPPPPQAPVPLPVPTQDWTTADVSIPFRWPVLGELPAPDPRQRKPPCAVRMGEEAINGVCWLRLDVRPPCPKDPDAYAFDHNGKCYAYALRAERPKQSGEPFPVNVAGDE